jgi:hypothetical protein
MSKDIHSEDNPDSLGSNSRDDHVHNVELNLPLIPEELAYLVEPAIHYGRKYKFDNDIQWFLENAEESDFETLATLAERARFSGDYSRLRQWSYEVDDVLDRIVDERYPYMIDISECREELLSLINEAIDPPDVAERRREKRLRQLAEASDQTPLADRRREMRMGLLTVANDRVHHMDIYFLFGLMDACNMKFEPG